VGGKLRGALLRARNVVTFAQIFFMRPVRQALPANPRLQPVW
jgi:hypothetical protein